MASSRITLKSILSDGTKLTKVIHFSTKKAKLKTHLMNEFEKYLDNLLLRNLDPK